MSKASNGWVIKRGARFRARIYIDDIEWSQTFDTKALGLDWLAQLRERHRIGRLRRGLDPLKITLGAALARYLSEITPHKKNHRKEASTIRRFLREEQRLCAIPLGHLMTADINDFSQRRMSQPSRRTGNPVSGSTVRNDLALISHLFTVARARWGYETLLNPVVPGTRPPPGKPRARRITFQEFERLFTEAQTYEADPEATVPIGDVIAFAGLTAMRREEIANLTWANVDLNRSVVTLLDTKNGSTRTVALREEAHALLCIWMTCASEERVFRCTNASIGTAWSRVRNRAGLKGLRLHDLRHEATSRFFEDAQKFALTDTEIGEITGHKTWAMLRRYTHLRSGQIARKLRPAAFSEPVETYAIAAKPALPELSRRGVAGRFTSAVAVGTKP